MKLSRLHSGLIAGMVLAVLFASGLAGVAPAQSAGVAEQAALVTDFEVNGLRVLVKRRPAAPTVAAGLFIRGGVRNLTDANAGIERFTLDAVAEASRKYPREAVRRNLARTGGSIGSGENNDYSVFSLASTKENFDLTWDMFVDLFVNPTFDPDDVNRVRDGILTGLREQESDADNFLQILEDRFIFAKHPYSRPVDGTIETISRLSPQDLRSYHRKILRTSQLLLVIVGDVDAGDLKPRIEKAFGSLPRGEYKQEPLPPLDFSKPTLDIADRALPTNYVQGVFEAPSLSSPDYYPMRVAMTWLQGRFFQEVRVKRQLSYAPNAELDTMEANTATIYVTAVDANGAVRVMLREIENLKTNPIDEGAISSIGGHFLTLYYIDQQSNAAQAAELAKFELIGGGWRNAFEFLNRLREVTPEQVQAVARKYMKNIRFVVVGEPAAIDRAVFFGEEHK